MSVLTHAESEWLARKPLIEDLYMFRRQTMDQVRDHLCGLGFHVNTRMVKTRLLKWNLHKKLSLSEVRTALELLGPHRASWPCESPEFRIRRKVVGLEDIVRSCRRRGITDPFQWIQTTPVTDTPSAEVELLTGLTPEESESEAAGPSQSFCPSASGSLGLPRVKDDSRERGFAGQSKPQAGRVSEGLAMERVRDPEVYRLGAQAIQHLRSFCLRYIASDNAKAHKEPPVHQFTSHARLQDLMSEGLFYFERNAMNRAFTSFRKGFLVLEEILDDVHPMAIALYLMLLCTLAAKKANVVAGKLLEQAVELASTRTNVPTSLVDALRVIHRSEEFLSIPLLCLKAAGECMETAGDSQWKNFYVQERYCDALYHVGFNGEGSLKRMKLLEAQEVAYGESARNVLVTSLNVAEGFLMQCQWDNAECRFNRVLRQAEELSGFHRAKLRVVALSGLSRLSTARALRWSEQQSVPAAHNRGSEFARRQMRLATGYVREALSLAVVWFEGSTRRTEVLRELQAEVQATSYRLGCPAECV
ncbi:uncharacterized protein Z520_07367 [Fonsecaea multimorphosa CBS 102226]|uniref:Clr5 domain-containing protein n=1 Tax=Fonsecaea multimorphosa CBS 102226 TaxID=1442371 RepID=A0A0D2KJ59_9EURO|nr:uncharacterized protein Z520_07367 [Fonsecaea multimorphosa CBS 102226]KIX96648.1 hypothetical protein Z520_07367 [Fonsecaea multimorphosa CBS 102226]OAL20730.1 hypothetical protein AYO22_08739 [Fonsecaea multimorphosa]